jgi:putative Holliday junction resolvase
MTGGRILGLDIGGERIGIAVSDEMGILASPVGLIRRNGPVATELRKLIETYSAVLLVAGLPVGLSGREGPQAAEVREYTDALAAEVGIPLEYWDERLSTSVAERSLIGAGVRRKQRRDRIDAIAASVILQGYLDHAKWKSTSKNR